MQVSAIIGVADAVIGVSILAAAAIGVRMGMRAGDAQKALIRVALIAVLLTVALLALTHGLATRIGPLVTRQTLLLCFGLVIGMVGGCGIGIARRRGNRPGAMWTTAVVVVLITTVMGAFFARVQAVAEAVNAIGGFQSARGYEPQKNKDCPENLKSLYLAFQQYAQDWDALPPAAKWVDNDDLISKVRQNEWLHCPAISNRHDDKYGYAYNDRAAGLKMNGKHSLADLPGAAQTPLLYDSTDLSKGAHDAESSLPHPGRHSGRNNMLYLDGHVDAMAPK